MGTCGRCGSPLSYNCIGQQYIFRFEPRTLKFVSIGDQPVMRFLRSDNRLFITGNFIRMKVVPIDVSNAGLAIVHLAVFLSVSQRRFEWMRANEQNRFS